MLILDFWLRKVSVYRLILYKLPVAKPVDDLFGCLIGIGRSVYYIRNRTLSRSYVAIRCMSVIAAYCTGRRGLWLGGANHLAHYLYSFYALQHHSDNRALLHLLQLGFKDCLALARF